MRRSSWITRGLLMTEIRHNEQNPDSGFERQDLGSRTVYGFLLSLAVIGVLVYFSVWGIFIVLDKYFSKHEAPPSPMMVEQKATTPTRAVPEGYVEKIFPEPRLETNERTEINDFRLGEEQTLNSYGWVDQNAGVVRIPITKAMELVAQRGLPTRPAAGETPQSPVNLANAAAAAADTSNVPASSSAKQKGKGKKQ
jgi:hypothetical protein